MQHHDAAAVADVNACRGRYLQVLKHICALQPVRRLVCHCVPLPQRCCQEGALCLLWKVQTRLQSGWMQLAAKAHRQHELQLGPYSVRASPCSSASGGLVLRGRKYDEELSRLPGQPFANTGDDVTSMVQIFGTYQLVPNYLSSWCGNVTCAYHGAPQGWLCSPQLVQHLQQVDTQCLEHS